MADTEEFPRQTVLVLGATGFVGTRLVEMLAASADFRPIAASRHIADRLSLAGVETRRCDATDPDDMREALTGVDLVVNCIAGSPKSMAAATETLCAVSRRLPPRRIVHLSSMAVYGGATGVVDETTEPVPPVTGYAWGKRASERMVREYVRDGGNAVILRPGCIHGPGSTQWTARIASLLQNQRIGDLGAAGDGYSNLVYIDDLVSAIMTALVRPDISGGVFNIAGTDPTTWNEFFLRFGRALGATPVPRLSSRRLALESRVVAPALRMAGLAARAIRLPRALMPEAITPSLVRLWRQDIQLDVSHANSRLDLPHTPLDRALTASVHWLATRPALSMHAIRPMGAGDTGARHTGARHI